MKKNKLLACLFALSVILQCIFTLRFNQNFYKYSFATGIKMDHFDLGYIVFFLFLFAPVIFIIFFFSESNYLLTHDYGKLLIIREYSKTKLIVSRFKKMSLQLMVLIIYQFLVFYFFGQSLIKVNVSQTVRSILLYYFLCLTLILFQFFFEFYFEPQKVNGILIVYGFMSYIISYRYPDNNFLKFIFFPGLAIGPQNETSANIINYNFNEIIILFFICLFFVLSLYKIKKSDIF